MKNKRKISKNFQILVNLVFFAGIRSSTKKRKKSTR
jgi:hypothetical protein